MEKAKDYIVKARFWDENKVTYRNETKIIFKGNENKCIGIVNKCIGIVLLKSR